MPQLQTTDWLALKERVNTLVTNPAMTKYEPGEIVDPPFDINDKPLPFILLSDVTNDNERVGINGSLRHTRSGTLMLTIQWPLAKPIGHAQLKELGASVAAHFPADLCMSFGPSRLRVTQDADALPSYIDGPYRVLPVRVFWTSMA